MSNRIAGFVNSAPDGPGWFVDAGYVMSFQSRRVQRKHGLVRYCGTTLAPKASTLFEVARVPEGLTGASSQQELEGAVGRNILTYIFGNHVDMVPYFARFGHRMQPFPFRAAVWVCGHGENYSTFDRIARGVPISPAFSGEYGLEPHTDVKAGLGSRTGELLLAAVSRAGSFRARILGRRRSGLKV